MFCLVFVFSFSVFLQTLMSRADCQQMAARELLWVCTEPGPGRRSSINDLEPGSPQRSSAWWARGRPPFTSRGKGFLHWTPVPTHNRAHHSAGETRAVARCRGPLGAAGDWLSEANWGSCGPAMSFHVGAHWSIDLIQSRSKSQQIFFLSWQTFKILVFFITQINSSSCLDWYFICKCLEVIRLGWNTL